MIKNVVFFIRPNVLQMETFRIEFSPGRTDDKKHAGRLYLSHPDCIQIIHMALPSI